jgi:hypothetical protein
MAIRVSSLVEQESTQSPGEQGATFGWTDEQVEQRVGDVGEEHGPSVEGVTVGKLVLLRREETVQSPTRGEREQRRVQETLLEL